MNYEKDVRGILGEGEVYQAWERNWDIVVNVDRSSLRGLVDINRLVEQAFFDRTFSRYHTILGDTDEAKQAVADAVMIHTFPAEGTIDKEKYDLLLEASHTKEQLSRMYILRHLKEGARFGLEPWEIDVLETSCRVAGVFDELCGRWREEVKHNPLNTQAKELGLTNQYSVIRQGENGLVQVSYAEAFEEQVHVITNEFEGLADRLTSAFLSLDEEQLAMAGYLQAYANALGSRNLDALGDLWREVDRIWLGVKGRIQPIASREYDYYDKNAIRVFPDFRLAILNEQSELLAPVLATQTAMIRYLGDEFGGFEVFEETRNGMRQIQIFPEAYDIVFAGSLDFQPSGQFLPNEFEIKRKYGIKVFLNLESSEDRWELALDLAQRVFPKDFELFTRVNHNVDGIGIQLAGHEIGEPLLDTDTVRRSLGSDVFRLLNEDTATLAATAIMPQREKSGELSREALENHAIVLLAIYLRYIDFARGVDTFEPYYKGMGLQGLRRMVDSGYVAFRDGELRIDVSKVDKLYELSMSDLEMHVAIAQQASRDLALEYLRPIDTVEELPEVKHMIDIIHPAK